MKKTLFPIIVAGTLLSGCAFTVHDVKVDYEYQQAVDLDLSAIPNTPLKIGEISDSRNVQNPRMIMHMKNTYGDTTSGGWQAEKPISEIVRDAIVQGISAAKVPLSDTGEHMLLEGELVDLDYQVVMGWWEGTVKSKLSVKLQMRNAQNNRIVWKDTFISGASVKGSKGAEGALRAALDDLINDLLNDEYFVQQLAQAE